MFEPGHPHRRNLVSALSLALLACFGGWLGMAHVGVPELDRTVLDRSRIQRNQVSSEVQQVLGPPPIVFDLGPSHSDWIAWSYPVRFPHPLEPLARAALLRVWLDADERVERWGFLHPLSLAPLVVRESTEEADAWRAQLQSRHCYNLRRIELATVLKAGVPMADVLHGMRWFSEAADSSLARSFVTFSQEGGRTVLSFYADRPSPLFIPSYYFQVLLSKSDRRVVGSSLEGYGGCE